MKKSINIPKVELFHKNLRCKLISTHTKKLLPIIFKLDVESDQGDFGSNIYFFKSTQSNYKIKSFNISVILSSKTPNISSILH